MTKRITGNNKIILVCILLFISLSHLKAQSRWQVSVSSGSVSAGFLIDQPVGYQIETKLFYRFSDSVWISISTGAINWEENIGTGGTSFSSIPLLVGVRQSFPLGIFTPYFSGAAGFHIINRNYTLEKYKSSIIFPGKFTVASSNAEEDFVTKFAFRFAIGSTIKVHKNFHFDLSLRYNNIAYDFTYNFHPSKMSKKDNLSLYELTLGAMYKF